MKQIQNWYRRIDEAIEQDHSPFGELEQDLFQKAHSLETLKLMRSLTGAQVGLYATQTGILYGDADQRCSLEYTAFFMETLLEASQVSMEHQRTQLMSFGEQGMIYILPDPNREGVFMLFGQGAVIKKCTQPFPTRMTVV
nr:hypothetical protein [Anaerolineae bacterium]